jgi:hypothetical protein
LVAASFEHLRLFGRRNFRAFIVSAFRRALRQTTHNHLGRTCGPGESQG